MSGDAGTCRLYLITPPKIDLGAFAHEIEAAFQGGDIACVQLRLKDASDDEIRAAAQTLMPIAHAHDAAFLINDSPELAVELGADGCHVGQEDTSYADARKIVGPDAIVGVTCHDSRHLAMEAGEAGADYVAFGAFFSTSTKTAKSEASAEILKWWSDLFEVPCVAIGGITTDNCSPLIKAGADFLAVSNGVWGFNGGPKEAVRLFNEKMAKAD